MRGSVPMTAQDVVGLAVMALISGHGPGSGQDDKGGREQALEQDGTGDVRGRDRASNLQAVTRDCDVVLSVGAAGFAGSTRPMPG